MTREHTHADHPHRHATNASAALSRALKVTLAFAAVEAIVGFVSGSLALLSDAAHMLVDSGALGLAVFAQSLAARPRTASHTFGFRRAEVIAAAVSGGALFTASIAIIIEAIGRLGESRVVRGEWMLLTAVVGLVVNIASGFFLMGEAHGSINVKAALAHVIADGAGSVAAIVASIAVLNFNLPQADAIASILISLLILWGAWRLMAQSASVLMEQTPPGVSVSAIEASIRATRGVRDLHDLHVWMISDGFPIVTVHVLLDGESHGADVAVSVSQRIQQEHGIDHVTVQPEAGLPVEAPLLMRPRRAS